MDDSDEIVLAYRAGLEQRLREQITRTRSHNPGATTQQIKELQRRHEIEYINALGFPEATVALTEYLDETLKSL